jgi:plasmid maintenance system killer protein
MKIVFKEEKFRKECNDYRLLQARRGTAQAKLIKRRLDDLRAVENLAVIRQLPGRCHELKGNRAGQLSIDLDGPYRLLFEPIMNPDVETTNSNLDWAKVTSIKIWGVENTHE